MCQANKASSGGHQAIFGLSEDAYAGDAQYSISVDGGATQTGTVTALHSSGQSQPVSVPLSNGSHTLVVTFLNDAWGGSPSTDRNLYVNSVQYDGVNTQAAGYALFATGDHYTISLPVVGLPIPPAAANAGYSKLTFNTDFTQPMPAGWLGGCPNPGNGQPLSPSQYTDDGGPHVWWQNLWWSANNYCITGQSTDPVYGGMVLDQTWILNANQDNVGNTLQSQSWDYAPGVGQSPNAFPRNAYYELVFRIAPLNVDIWAGLFTWGTLGTSTASTQPDVEWDVIETWGGNLNGYDSAVHDWGNASYNPTWASWVLYPWTSLNPGTNFDASKYNTYGLSVVTSQDGSSAIGCTYVNNVFQICSPPVPLSVAEQGQKNFILLQNACHTGNNCPDGTRIDNYVKSVRVWVSP